MTAKLSIEKMYHYLLSWIYFQLKKNIYMYGKFN